MAFSPYQRVIPATFIDRPNRFIAHVHVNNSIETVHVAATGKMKELLIPNAKVYLTPAANKNRKTKYTLVAVDYQNKPRIIDSQMYNRIFEQLFPYIPEFKNWKIIKPEYTLGDSRFDFYIENKEKKGLVEVKSVTLIENNLASFPDAVSERAVKHVNGLIEHSKKNYEPFTVFLISVPAKYFIPNFHLHPAFHEIILKAQGTVNTLAYSFEMDEKLNINKKVLPVKIPFQYLNNVNLNSGTYISIYTLNKNKKITVGALGEKEFQAGYYCYVGSALNSLSTRTKRHTKKVKNKKWHIDYIHPPLKHIATEKFVDLAIECNIAEKLSEVYSGIQNFGASDCKCKSHLFYSKTNPLNNPEFIKRIFSLRFNGKYIASN